MTNVTLNDLFTHEVNQYLEKGYVFHLSTMGGTQGEIAKVDLTNGDQVIRVLAQQKYEDFESYCTVEIRRYDMPRHSGITLWNSDGDLITLIEIGRKED